MSATAQLTPWQKMKAFDIQYQKIEDNPKIRERNKPKVEPGVIMAEPICPCNPFLTYYNNGKVNRCCKTGYDYNYFYCDGYDQERHREDRKHPFFYMNIDLEEEYPCRTVPLLTSSNYGHRPLYDTMGRIPRKSAVKEFRRNSGAAYCVNTNGNGYVYNSVSYLPMKPFMWNAQYGYTYAPPRNN